MREILFRAKRKNWRELPKEEWWVEGYLIKGTWYLHDKEIFAIVPIDACFYPGYTIGGWIEIDPDTICQAIGLKDKNGKMIYEHDILKGYKFPFCHDGDFNYYGLVKWDKEYKCYYLVTVKNPESSVAGVSHGDENCFEGFNSENWEVIGNTFDNQELLKGKG